MKRLFTLRALKYATAFLIPLIFIVIAIPTLNNDTWFVLAEGRYITDGGIYYTDVLSMHEGLDITVQQYGFAVIFWLVYSAFGFVGLYLMTLILNLILCYFIYKICMLLSHKNVNLSLLLMILTDLLLALGGFVTTRAQMVSYVILLATIYILELYVKTSKSKYLWWLPFLSILQINLHASVWWMLPIVIGVYIIDSFKAPKLHLQGYRTKPLILMLLLTFAVGFLNPYGYKMVTFIFTSYGTSAIVNLVNEMAPFDLRGVFNIILYASLAITLILCILGNGRRIKMRYLLLLFGFLALGLNSIKGMSQLVLILFLPLAFIYHKVRIESVLDPGLGRNAILFWCGITSIAIAIVLITTLPAQLQDSPSTSFTAALDAIDTSVAESQESPSSLKIYSGYNWGGYLEFRGYKPYLDPRAEVFISKPSADEDSILEEYIHLRRGKVDANAFIDKYQFDYLFTDEHDSGLYDLDRSDYVIIYNEPDTFRIYKHVTSTQK